MNQDREYLSSQQCEDEARNNRTTRVLPLETNLEDTEMPHEAVRLVEKRKDDPPHGHRFSASDITEYLKQRCRHVPSARSVQDEEQKERSFVHQFVPYDTITGFISSCRSASETSTSHFRWMSNKLGVMKVIEASAHLCMPGYTWLLGNSRREP